MPNSRQISGLILLFSTGGQRSRSVRFVLWEATVESDGCSSVVLWWHAYLPLGEEEILIFTLNAYLSHFLPPHVPLRHLNLSTNLMYFPIHTCLLLLHTPEGCLLLHPRSWNEGITMELVGCCSNWCSNSPWSKQFLILRKWLACIWRQGSNEAPWRLLLTSMAFDQSIVTVTSDLYQCTSWKMNILLKNTANLSRFLICLYFAVSLPSLLSMIE